jgi:cold shock CspA family protein
VPQGTVKDFDRQNRTGTLLTDAEEEVAIDPGSVEGAGIRYLRIGQRVKFDLAEEGGKKVARTLRIVTFDD